MKINYKILALFFIITYSAQACLWDRDTLTMERKSFPGAIELIAGKFPYLSKDYYEWRIKDRKEKIKKDPSNIQYYDDLAVALDKTGKHDEAISFMQIKEKLVPGQYETLANLGTFYLHKGDFEKGIEFIQKALRINPDAHFGREKYQLHLAKVLLNNQKKNGKIKLPLNEKSSPFGYSSIILNNMYPDGKIPNGEIKKAGKGVMGMMRFGDHKHPVLLEAIAEISDKRIQARAYLRASYETADKKVAEAYRKKAKAALNMQTVHPRTTENLELEMVEKTFKQELQQAKEWRLEVDKVLKDYISKNKELDDAFWDRFASAKLEKGGFNLNNSDSPLILAIKILVSILIFLGIILVSRKLLRKTP